MTSSVSPKEYFEVNSFDGAANLVDGSEGMDDEEVWERMREDWRNIVQQNFDPDEPERLPGYDLDIGSTTYRVRGLSHGQPGTDLSLDEEDIKTLEGYIQSYSKEGSVYTEQGFPELFEVIKANDNVNELHDTSTAFKAYRNTREEVKDSMEAGVEMANILAPFIDLTPTPENLREDFIEARGDNVPLQIKEDYEKSNNRVQGLLDAVRSKNQLDEAVSRSSDKTDDPVTLVVGMQHVPQIKDYGIDHYDAELSDHYF
jgi:hypothetical protein